MNRRTRRLLPVLGVAFFNIAISLLTLFYLLGDGCRDGKRAGGPDIGRIICRTGR